jgi:hypothetical protein
MTPMYVSALGQSASPAASATPPAAATTPAQMRRFYSADNINFNGVPGDGRGMTIAIVDAYHYATASSDLAAFDAYYGLPDPPSLQIVNQNGQASNYPGRDAPGGWGIESALDVQWAHAMAPLANIVLVEAASDLTGDLFQAVTTAANMTNVVCVSMSFGTAELGGEASSWDSNFLTPSGHGGVTFLAATGDKGTPGTYPAFSPNVVAVGGTGISHAPDGTYISESAWGGGGGGTSSYEPRPAYQNGVQSSAFRTIPDVSMDSQPTTGVAIYDPYDLTGSTPWGQYGGTSLATPMFAGLVAIADQGRVSIGQTSLNGRTQTLPALYSLPSGDFHDITTGASDNGATATAGYDLATGIGTPVANLLVNHLAGAVSVTPQLGGTSGNDNFTLSVDINRLYIDWSNGVSSGQVAVNDPNGLTLNGGGGNDTLTLNSVFGNPLPNLLKLNGHFTIEGWYDSDELAGKTIDINRSTVSIDYGFVPDPSASIRQYITSGYNGGAWNGQATASAGVITSSSAATSAGVFGVGYAGSADGLVSGQPVNSVEIKYTVMGDANLDGVVDSSDAVQMARNYLAAGKSNWDQGNFNYDSTINLSDAQILQKNFGVVATGSALAATAAAVNSAATVATPVGATANTVGNTSGQSLPATSTLVPAGTVPSVGTGTSAPPAVTSSDRGRRAPQFSPPASADAHGTHDDIFNPTRKKVKLSR